MAVQTAKTMGVAWAMAVAVTLGGTGSGRAEPAASRLVYSVSIAGLPIAAADLTLGLRSRHYDTRLDWHTTGLAELFAGAHGEVSASGRIDDGRTGQGRPTPERYRLTGTTGRTALQVVLAMAGGRVRSATTEPQTRPSGDLVPLGPEHRRGVLDPLSAILTPARETGAGVCDRTVPVFDGWSRYDVRLTPKAVRDMGPSGFSGPVMVCAARWVPIAGHRSEHKGVRYMAENTDIEIAFGRLAGHDLWLPVDVRVATMIGTARATVETATVAAPATGLHKRRRIRS